MWPWTDPGTAKVEKWYKWKESQKIHFSFSKLAMTLLKTAVKMMERYIKTAISSKLFPIFVVSLLPACRYINWHFYFKKNYCTVHGTRHILPLKGLIAFLSENSTVIENIKSTANTKCQHNPEKIHKICSLRELQHDAAFPSSSSLSVCLTPYFKRIIERQ